MGFSEYFDFNLIDFFYQFFTENLITSSGNDPAIIQNKEFRAISECLVKIVYCHNYRDPRTAQVDEQFEYFILMPYIQVCRWFIQQNY